jgi:hypothetical protein
LPASLHLGPRHEGEYRSFRRRLRTAGNVVRHS